MHGGLIPAAVVGLFVETRPENIVHPSEGTFPGGPSSSAIFGDSGEESSTEFGSQQSRSGYPERALLQRLTPHARDQNACAFCLPFPVLVDNGTYPRRRLHSF